MTPHEQAHLTPDDTSDDLLSHFSVTSERLGDTRCVLSTAGEVDMYTAPEFKRELLAAIDDGAREIEIDLTRATFIDSTFLGILISAQKRLGRHHGSLSIRCTDHNLRKVFEITGLDRVFTIHNSNGTHPTHEATNDQHGERP